MSLADATPDEVKQVNDYTLYIRGLSGEFMRLMNKMQAATNTWDAMIAEIIGTPDGTPINDGANLIGTDTLTDEDVSTITSYFEGCLASYYIPSIQQLLTRAAGTANVV